MSQLFLYKLTQDDRTGYDTYDSCVVAAESKEAARQFNPDGEWDAEWAMAWASSPDLVTVQLLGVADPSIEAGIILASFNAG
jgi:hypothetical protein